MRCIIAIGPRPVFLACLLGWCSAAGAGDAVQFDAVLRFAATTYQASLDTAPTNHFRDTLACTQERSRPKRQRCTLTADSVYSAAIAAANTTFQALLLDGAGPFYGVDPDAVAAELARQSAVQLAADWALFQARLTACVAAATTTCDEVSFYH